MAEAEKGTLWIEPRCRPLPITDTHASQPSRHHYLSIAEPLLAQLVELP